MTTSEDGSAGFSDVLGKVWKELATICDVGGQRTYQVPSVVGDGQEFILCHDGPDKAFIQRIRRELKVELDIICGAVVQINEGPSGLE